MGHQGVKEKTSAGAHGRRNSLPGIVGTLLYNEVVGHVDVGKGTYSVSAWEDLHASVLFVGVIEGEPTTAKAHRFDGPVRRILVHPLGRAHLGRLQEERIAKHPQVGPQDLLDNADDVLIQTQLSEALVVLGEPGAPARWRSPRFDGPVYALACGDVDGDGLDEAVGLPVSARGGAWLVDAR